jgi:ParB family chromosome partitioning protein
MLPITVVVSKTNPNRYTLVAGERRLQASKLAGLDTIPAMIRELSDQDMAEMAIIENIHRKELNPVEEAHAYLKLQAEFGLSFEDIAHKVSKTKTYVENKIRITRLPRIIQNAIAVGEISENHGKALYGLNDEEAMIAALKIVIRNGLSAQKTEQLVRQIKAESEGMKKSVRSNPTIEWEQKFSYIREDLSQGMGFNIKLKRHRSNGGAILINFNNDDELVSIYRKIRGGDSE